MGSLAASHRIVDGTVSRPVMSLVDEVASIARKELAPLAAAIDAGRERREFVARDRGDLVGYRRHGTLERFDPRCCE